MNSFGLTAMTLTGALLLGGCGGGASEGGADEGKEPMPVEDSVFGGHVEQMNKAREQTDRLSRERMDNLNRQIENAQ